MRRPRQKREVHFATPEEERSAAVKKAMDLLLYRDRSEKELSGRLREAGYSEAAVSAALAYVRDYGYLNDRRFAETYVAVNAAGKGRARIARELRDKGVAEEHIEHALEQLPDGEEDLAGELLSRRLGEPHRLDDREIRRVFSFLARRGFSSSDIWRAIRKYLDSVIE